VAPFGDEISAGEQLELARTILNSERDAIGELATRLDHRFCQAVSLCLDCRGHVVVSGMGKAGLIGQKISATLSSTGTRSLFLHPAEAFHGDLGMVHPDDTVLMLSLSGSTEEVVRLLPSLKKMGNPLIAITGTASSPLGRQADVVLELGSVQEVCGLGLAPTTSTTMMLSLGDAIALITSRLRCFSSDDFARFHPGGNLGRRLAYVDEMMRPLDSCRVASADATVRDVLVCVRQPGRRTGAIMLVDDKNKLVGIFTDSDLARLFETRRDDAVDGSIRDVMTVAPTTIQTGTRLGDAVELLAAKKISELPVVDEQGSPLGLIDITDLLGYEVAQSKDELTSNDATQSTLPFLPDRRETA